MWLINTVTLNLEYFPTAPRFEYAILSHTWEEDEVLFKDMYDIGHAKSKKGWSKVQMTCRLARKQSLAYAWVDTCCIDKSSSAELSEAINSMFRWYQMAGICYAYLSDLAATDSLVDSSVIRPQLKRCKWFTRGWTLQELISPPNIIFFDSTWTVIGSKQILIGELSSITGVDVAVLQSPSLVFNVPVGKRMSWAAKRVTTRGEDVAYCLLGMFRVHMPLLYGEGSANAFTRLQEHILGRRINELSIFAWMPNPTLKRQGVVLADSPKHFAACTGMTAPTVSGSGDLLVVGSSLELTEPVYNEIPLGEGDTSCEEIHLDLNISEQSERTGHRPMWVTLPLERRRDAREFSRKDNHDFEYYATRPWLYNSGPPNHNILLRKEFKPWDSAANPTTRPQCDTAIRFHESMEHVLYTPVGTPGSSGSPALLIPSVENELAFHLCPFSHRGQGNEFGHMFLGTFMVSVGRNSDKIILILLYARHWAVETGLASRKRAIFASICPKNQPDYYEAIKSILTTPGNTYEQQLPVVFDYAFQFLLDPLMSKEGPVKDPSHLQRSVEIGDTEDASVTHRFLATAAASFLEYPVTVELPPTFRDQIPAITIRYEMLRKE